MRGRREVLQERAEERSEHKTWPDWVADFANPCNSLAEAPSQQGGQWNFDQISDEELGCVPPDAGERAQIPLTQFGDRYLRSLSPDMVVRISIDPLQLSKSLAICG